MNYAKGAGRTARATFRRGGVVHFFISAEPRGLGLVESVFTGV